MKIAFLSAMMGHAWGGSEELWSQAAPRLASAGADVLVYVARQRQQHPRVEALRSAGVALHEVRRRRKLERKLGWREPLAAGLAQARPDLLVISLGALFDGLDAMRAARASGVRYVLIVQAVIETWRPEYWAEYRELFLQAAFVYYVAEDNRRSAMRLLMLPEHPSKVVPNPYKVRHDAALPWPADDGVARLAMVARLEFPAKGHELLFEVLAAPRWRARRLEVGLFGAGPHEQYFRAMVEFWKLGAVRFCGHVDDVADIWRRHHALVLPSRYEGTPIALVEAMLSGRPAVVTDIAGNTELVEDGVSGFVAPAPTARHLDAALERAWARRAEWPQLGQAAAARARACVPADPPGAFAAELRRLAEEKRAG